MKRLLCVVFLVVFLNVTNRLFAEDLPPATPSAADEKLLADLETARKTWLESVSLYGHYSFKRAVFFSEEDAVSKEIEDDETIAEGLLCKKQDKCRLQVLYKESPNESSKGVFSHRSDDSIVNRHYRIFYNPAQGKDFPSGGTLTKAKNGDFSDLASELSCINTPFRLFLNPVDFFSDTITIDSKPSCLDLGDGRVKIFLSGKNQAGNKTTKEVVFRTTGKVPVIESIATHSPNGDKTVNSLIVGLDWIESGGLEIPSRIRSYSGPLKPVDSDSDTWVASEWKSKDLNSREPEDGDFVLKLNKGERLEGMRHIPRDRRVDLDRITDEDLLSGGLDYGLEDGNTFETALGFAWRIAPVLAGAGLILFSFFIRKRNKAESAG